MTRWEKTGRTLAAGGQGQIFVVTDATNQDSTEYAMKVLSNPTRSERLDLEIATMKSLNRTGCSIIPIIDDYTSSEPEARKPWYVMPIADGGSLSAKLKPGECFGGSELAALTAFAEIAAAVREIHDRRVAHRDLKPANILIHRGKIYLCDLGLCLPLGEDLPEERLTGILERIGSLHYTPREAFGRRPLDQNQFAFDAYALGKILYELLAGRVLPGFCSPNDPEFDLAVARPKPLYAGINAVLRGLLSDDSSRRLGVLQDLPTQVSGILKWAGEVETNEKSEAIELKEKMATASEALVRKFTAQPSASVDPALKSECEEVAHQIFAKWNNDRLIQGLKAEFVGKNSDMVELRAQPKSTHLRELVHAPFTKTRRALEPLEDNGFPTRAADESGCAFGLVAKGDHAKKLPETWLGSLVVAKGTRKYVAFAIIRRELGVEGFTDIVPGTAKVFSGSRDDPLIFKSALDHAAVVARRFVEDVLEQVTPKK
jgi:serine/threonine protein kinase